MITITRTSKTTAQVIANGVTFYATFDAAMRRWSVQTPNGVMHTDSPKVNSLGRIFAPVTVTGASSAKSRRPRAPRAPRVPGQPRAPRGSRRGGPVFSTPKPTVHGLRLVAVAALEDVFVTHLRDTGVTPEAQKAWDTYSKLKALALGGSNAGSASLTAAQQTEAATALRLATVALVKLAF